MKKRSGILRRLFRWTKRFVLVLLLLQLVYIIALKWVFPPITITQLNSLMNGDGLKRKYVTMDEISPYAKLAVIAAEDQLFPEHNGFDWNSIEKALEHNKKSRRTHGASTLSQQVAKNVFLWQERSWVRKGLEVYFTFMIELVWGKERILEVYMNVVEMGEGIYGIEAASQWYFYKASSQLTRVESAQIASALPNPKRYTVRPLSAYTQRRHQWVLAQMSNLRGDPEVDLLTGFVKKNGPKSR